MKTVDVDITTILRQTERDGEKRIRGHTDLNHGPIGLQPIALPLSYIPRLHFAKLRKAGRYIFSSPVRVI